MSAIDDNILTSVPITRLLHAAKKNTFKLLRCSTFYQRVNLAFIIPSVVISTVLGTAVVSNEVIKSQDMRYVLAVFAFLNAFLISLTRAMRPAEQAQQCDFFAHKWANFVRNVQADMVLRGHETDKKELFVSSLKAYNDIMDISIYMSNQLNIDFMDDMVNLQ